MYHGRSSLDSPPRRRRPRREALGELVQWDSSVHPWLEGRGPPDLVLVALHDDATGRMLHGRFVERDTGAANRRTIVECLKRHGRPAAEPRDAHRPLPPGIDLEALFAETETRAVGRDYAVRWKNGFWQISEAEDPLTPPKTGQFYLGLPPDISTLARQAANPPRLTQAVLRGRLQASSPFRRRRAGFVRQAPKPHQFI